MFLNHKKNLEAAIHERPKSKGEKRNCPGHTEMQIVEKHVAWQKINRICGQVAGHTGSFQPAK